MQGLCIIGNFIPIIQNAPRGCAHSILYRNENQEIKGIIARMKRIKKQAVLESITLLENANEYVTADLKPEELMNILTQCQEAAILTGNDLETQGECTKELITMLEEYCELIFQISQSMDDPENRRQLAQTVRNLLIRLHSKTVELLPEDRKEIVFLPYKASMWDSLESVWKAADADPECDAYVIPIPYFDRNADGTVKEMHYEGDLFPDYVPVTKYDAYDFGQRRPDAVFIHNPYDGANFVTSVHPFFYSDNLKKYTDCLVYIPYFASAGGMSEGQYMCPAYIYADYIVIQSGKYRKFYAPEIPDEKFLAFGSPKFDSIIQKCNNQPKVQAAWKEKATKADGTRKKVYFYNTSIGGMLGDTPTFLKKMKYVFDTFKGREDVCLLWRPHPLLESTFASMRREYKAEYDTLKKSFIEEKQGIYDDTPGIEDAIAFCDVYIGDEGTSVTSLFGVVGKPLFIFDNYINTLPQKDDWRGEVVNPVFDMFGDDRFHLTANNKLWYSEKNDYHYKFYMDLAMDYAGGSYYMKAIQKKDKLYVIPRNAQHLLIIKDKKIIEKIEFKDKITQSGAFYSYRYTDRYLFLIPFNYPYLIRYEFGTGELYYMSGVKDFAVRNTQSGMCAGGVAQYGNELVIASPVDHTFLFIEMDFLQTRVISSHTKSNAGTQAIIPDGKTLWLLPLNGMTLSNWDPETGEIHEYDDRPEGFKAIKFPQETEVMERPFGNIAVERLDDKERVVLSPSWGNMYAILDPVTGKMENWEVPVGSELRGKNGYYRTAGMGGFVLNYALLGSKHRHIWYAPERKLYDINIETKECKEIPITFDYAQLEQNATGFAEQSEWIQYCCREDSFNSLKDLLDDTITGERFDKKRQLAAFARINAGTEGNCGQQVYDYLCKKK